jgi:predicted O-methyltransferase YrrM
VPVGPGAGSALSFLASAVQARAVAEIGTGTGVSGLWLLRGMQPDGVLTSVDLEAEHQRLARETFAEAGYAPQRFRLIAGSGLDVMARLTDAGYDLVFLDGDKVEYGEYLEQAVRLVRPGGLIVFHNALWHDRVADPSQRDPETAAIREVVQHVATDDRLRSTLLPLGDGLLAAQLLA